MLGYSWVFMFSFVILLFSVLSALYPAFLWQWSARVGELELEDEDGRKYKVYVWLTRFLLFCFLSVIVAGLGRLHHHCPRPRKHEPQIVDPHAGSTCQAGVPCTVSWVDDGMRPLFSAIGVSTVGLYTGKQQLVQRIAPVDVTKQTSLTFTVRSVVSTICWVKRLTE